MLDREAITKYADRIKDHAELVVPEDGTMRPIIGVWRDDECWIWLFPRTEGRDPIVTAAQVAIVGMEPDTLTLAHDTYRATQQTRKDGSEWPHGGMQYAREHNTEDAELVEDSINIMMMDRTGSAATVNLGYKVTGGKLEWLEDPIVLIEGEKEEEGEDGGRLGGYVADMIRDAFTKPTVRQQMSNMSALEQQIDEDVQWLARFAMGSTDEPSMSALEAVSWAQRHPKEAYAHMCCAVIKAALLPQGCAVLLGINDPEIAEIFDVSLNGYPGVEMHAWRGEDGPPPEMFQ